jgi:hypothetical protein
MRFRLAIWLCTIIVGVFSLTLCQPPRPRIAGVEVPPFPTVNNAETKDILTASSQAERIIQVRDPDGLLTHDVSRHR